jgi:predicted amidohydrolase YtcJ
MKTPADLVLVNGTVYTMDPLKPRADAVAVRDGRIAAVGSRDDVMPLVGPATRVVDLAGRSVSPGLTDGHCHLYGLGKSLEILALRGLKSAKEAAALVAKEAAARPAGEWIEGRGWDQNLWSPAAFPDRRVLDEAAPRHPVALRRIDGHAVWVNGAALAAAGVTRDTPDPPGGKILRDERGEPTGVFVDTAMALVEQKIPDAKPDAIRRRILHAAKEASEAGLTGVHEMGISDAVVTVYRELASAGLLPLRVYAFLDASHVPELPRRRPDATEAMALFTLRGVKLYADGALGSRGALLLAPYSDDPRNTGLVVTSKEDLTAEARTVAQAGWQLAVHAIGDLANRNVLDAIAAAHVGPEARFRIEHAQIVAPEDVPRFAALGVAASMQPTHATSDMPWAEARVGKDRIRGAYAWRTMLSAHAHVVAGSDFPIEEVSPLLGLYSFVTRQDGDGKPPGGWLPEQKLTLDEALRAFTVEPAWAGFAENDRGRVVPGFVADLTVYDRLLAGDRRLLDTKIDMTIVGGKVAYERR